MEGYLAYRCPHCGSDRCGNDANSGWDVVLQQSVLLGEFDNQWCNDCGDVTLEEFTITDPIEIARIDAARGDLRAARRPGQGPATRRPADRKRRARAHAHAATPTRAPAEPLRAHGAEVRRSFIATTVREESQVAPQGRHR